MGINGRGRGGEGRGGEGETKEEKIGVNGERVTVG